MTKTIAAREPGLCNTAFAARAARLNMLADFQPDVLKIDMALTRAVNTDPVRYEIARAIIGLCESLHISVIAEGVETVAEAVTLRDLGVRLFHLNVGNQ